MQTERFAAESIEIGPRERPLDDAAVERLAESIRQIGLQTPVTIRWAKDEEGDEYAMLVAGHHRLEACKRAGVQFVDCVIMTNETDARLWEISENLHRADLTAQERAEHIAEWVRITDEKKLAQVAPVSGRGRVEGRGNKGGINAAVRELGIDRTEAQRAIKVANLTPEAKQAARDTGRDDNRTALLHAAQQPPERQAEAIRSYVPAKPAPAIKNAFESEEDWRRSLFTVWNRGAQDWRDRALEALDRPVFDHTLAGAA